MSMHPGKEMGKVNEKGSLCVLGSSIRWWVGGRRRAGIDTGPFYTRFRVKSDGAASGRRRRRLRFIRVFAYNLSGRPVLYAFSRGGVGAASTPPPFYTRFRV